MVKVLIIGSGGREHAIAIKISESQKLTKLFAIPGNPGISNIGECYNIDIMNNDAIVKFSIEKEIDLVIIGPEAPLVNGLTDALESKNIKVFGPSKIGALFEGSKTFARKFMQKYNLPSVEFSEFDNLTKAIEYIKNKGAPIVVKADGLAAGKGVLVANNVEDAINFAKDCLENNKFGSSKILIEECLVGEEASYHVFIDGKTYKPMAYSQDHKQINEGDKGPNTGGMGAYSPAPLLEGFEEFLDNKIMKPFIQGTIAEKINYKGVLYVGLMITSNGPKILEFNCRFGDPETQVILPRLKTDLIDIMFATVDGVLDKIDIEWTNEHCICVVLASQGYPHSYEKGKIITGLEKIQPPSHVIHAGTKKIEKNIVSNGGRVLNIVSLRETLQDAYETVYEELKNINFEGMYFRKDIGKKELERKTNEK